MTMKLVNKRGPLYLQVQEILKERIISEQYPINTLIPSEPELKEEFGVSMITIRKAVEQLALQGYVEKRSGIGTIVLANEAISKLTKGHRFADYLIQEGYDLKKCFVGLSKIESIDDANLQTYFPEGSYCIEHLYMLDEKPYIHFRHYIPGNIIIPEDIDHFQNSLYEIMYQQGIQFHSFKEEFGVAEPEERIAEMLNIESKPLLHRMRFSYDIYNNVVEYSIGYYNTDLHKYVVKYDT